jgi:hypothetical protein
MTARRSVKQSHVDTRTLLGRKRCRKVEVVIGRCFHAIDSRPVWWTALRLVNVTPILPLNRNRAGGLTSSYGIPAPALHAEWPSDSTRRSAVQQWPPMSKLFLPTSQRVRHRTQRLINKLGAAC